MRWCALCLLLLGCEDPFPVGEAPEIQEIRPASALAGQQVTLVGLRFGRQGPADRVWLGGQPVVVRRWSDRALEVEVPPDARAGVFDFVVQTEGWVSPPTPFEVLGAAVDAGDVDGG